MELQLDRKLSNKRVFPAIDLTASSTRRDDLLHDKETLQRIWVLRNHLADMNSSESMEFRSEEHTSELQSLMRISYAVFCLKKKKSKIQQQNKKPYTNY